MWGRPNARHTTSALSCCNVEAAPPSTAHLECNRYRRVVCSVSLWLALCFWRFVTSPGRALGCIVWPAWAGSVLCSSSPHPKQSEATDQRCYETSKKPGRDLTPPGIFSETRPKRRLPRWRVICSGRQLYQLSDNSPAP